MPLFLLRDGSIRRFKAVPEGLNTTSYLDRYNRTVHVVLDARGERALLAASAGGRRHDPAGERLAGGGGRHRRGSGATTTDPARQAA
jgi:hypothetical protein